MRAFGILHGARHSQPSSRLTTFVRINGSILEKRSASRKKHDPTLVIGLAPSSMQLLLNVWDREDGRGSDRIDMSVMPAPVTSRRISLLDRSPPVQ
jgi:hypothetical protein